MGAEHDFDTGAIDSHPGDIPQHDAADVGFKLLSLQGLTAFFLMFGLVGLALSRQTKAGSLVTMVGATAAGLVMMLVMAKIFTSMKRLQASGNIDVKNALGTTGTVYADIPADGTGQIQICIQGRLRIYDAKTKDSTPIKTGMPVIIVDVIANNTLVVKKSD